MTEESADKVTKHYSGDTCSQITCVHTLHTLWYGMSDSHDTEQNESTPLNSTSALA